MALKKVKGRLLIKIDVEDHEADVLLGAKEVLNLRPAIIMECNSQATGKKCTEILSEYNYSYYNIIEESSTIERVVSIEPQLSNNKISLSGRNKLLLPKEKEEDLLKFESLNLSHKSSK